MIAPPDAGSRRREGGGNGGSSHDWKTSLPLLRALLEDLKDYAVILLNRAGCVVTWSSGAEALKGYREAEILGAHVSKFYASEDVAAGLPQIELDTAAGVGRFEDEGWRVRNDGSQFWADVVLTALHDEQGAVWGFLQITRDLTERRAREQETRESEERFRLLVGGVRDYAIFTLDPRGYVTTWNAGARHIKGYEPHEIIGSHFSRFYPPEAIARQWPEYELRIATLEGRFEDEGWRVRKDGSHFWANVVITALRDSGGQLRGFSKITRDLSERRKQEESLRRSEERFRLLVEGVRDHALFTTDTRGFITSWNSGAERTTGHEAAQIIGKHIANFYRVDEVGEDQPWRDLALARRTGRLEVEGWRLRHDGASYWAKAIVTSLTDAHGEFYGYAHLLQDLTQQKHAQQLEDVSTRMNEFIALLAHELRNPLAPIRNAVMLMQRKGLGDPVLESMRATIERQCLTLDRILTELLDVSRIARGELRLEMRPIDLTQVVARAIEVSRPHIDQHGHELTVQLPDCPLPFLGDALRLNQMIVNLLNNAAKYTAPGGKLWLSLLQHADGVELRVRDTGVGIPAESLGRVFDLFYQGREVLPLAEGGLGVGLALVRRVAELHGGVATVSSAGADQGSEFIVSLPNTALSASASSAPSAPPREPEPELPRHRVLVAEDNLDAAMTFEVLLQSLGQDTCVVHDGVAALEAFERFKPQILMLDIGMPKLNGYEVAHRIRGLAGASVVLVAVTGWGQDADRERAREAGFDHHFVKPLSEAALRKVLSAEPAR